MAPDATKPPTATQDPPAKKEVPKTMDIVLATLPLPAQVILQARAPRPQKQRPLNLVKPLPKERL